MAQLCPGLCCVTLNQSGPLSGPQRLHLYLLDWSSSLPLSFMAELSRGDPDHPAQRPFQPSQVTKSRHGPSREKLPWAPPAHTATLCLWDLIRPGIWRGNSGSLAAASLAGLMIPSQPWRQARQKRAPGQTPLIFCLGEAAPLSSMPHSSPEAQDHQPWECQRNGTLSLLTLSTASGEAL